jgi:hypothetical protein
LTPVFAGNAPTEIVHGSSSNALKMALRGRVGPVHRRRRRVAISSQALLG